MPKKDNEFEGDATDEISRDRVTPRFPLTPDEVHLLYTELRTYTFSRQHPMFLYASPLLDRMREFIEEHKDHMRICNGRDV